MKRERLEGGWDSKLTKLIRDTGYNQDVNVELGTVKSPPPNLRINIDGMKIDLEADDFIVAEHLTEYTRTISLSGGQVTGTTPHGTLSSLTVTDAELTFKSALKEGDRVIVLSASDNQQYYVIDKAVTY